MEKETIEELKMKRFWEGWYSVAGRIYASSSYDKISGTFRTWNQLLEPVSVFESFSLGQAEGRKYFNAVNGIITNKDES